MRETGKIRPQTNEFNFWFNYFNFYLIRNYSKRLIENFKYNKKNSLSDLRRKYMSYNLPNFLELKYSFDHPDPVTWKSYFW